MDKFDKEIKDVQEEIAGLPLEKQVEYRTGLVNNMLDRLSQTAAINIQQVSNGSFSFGDYEYNNIIMLSIIVILFERLYPGKCYTMSINQEIFVLVIETPLGNYLNHMPQAIKQAFPIRERELDESILKQDENYSLDILFSLLDSESEEE